MNWQDRESLLRVLLISFDRGVRAFGPAVAPLRRKEVLKP